MRSRLHEGDLDVQVKDNILTVKGQKKDDESGRKYLHRGIATRGFERQSSWPTTSASTARSSRTAC